MVKTSQSPRNLTMWKLNRRDIAPPGGFRAKSPLGVLFLASTFSEIETRLSRHLAANGRLPQDAEAMIDEQTSKYLAAEKEYKWIQKTT